MRKLLYLLSIAVCLNFASCSEVECPLDSVVVMTCGLYDADTKAELPLQQTLTIKPVGKDTVLLNVARNIRDFILPLKMGETADTMLFYFTDEWDNSSTDTLVVNHENLPHFESVECPATIFHKLTSLAWMADKKGACNVAIDSVAIVRNLVDYNDVENIQIYLRSAH